MDAFIVMLKNVIVFVLLAIPGFILSKKGMVKEKESGVLSKILMYVGMPFLIISTTLNIEFNLQTALVIGISFIATILFYVVLITATTLLVKKPEDDKKKGMVKFSMLFANSGFLGIPLAKAVFGETQPLVVVSVIVVCISMNIIMYTYGVNMVAGSKKKVSIKNIFLNPVFIAFIIGVIINLTNVSKNVVEVSTYTNYLSNIVTPLSMMIIGIKLGGIKFSSLFTTKTAYLVSAVKLVIVPTFVAGVMLIVNLFLSIPTETIIGLFITFSMPTAGLASTFADYYDGDNENAVIFTLSSTIFSCFTISVLYYLLALVL